MVSQNMRNSFTTLNNQINGYQDIKIELIEEGLQLSLDINKKLFEDYEEVRLSERNGLHITYSAFHKGASKTFSGKYEEIPNFGLLSKLRLDFKKISNLDSENYKQMLFLKKSAISYEEAHMTMNFFTKVFIAKAQATFS